MTRALVVSTLRPHLKGRPSAKTVFPLPWDNEKVKEVSMKCQKSLTAEESKMRFEKLLKVCSINSHG